jgi:hypothetical protein
MNIRSIPTNRVQAPRLATCQARLAGFTEVQERQRLLWRGSRRVGRSRRRREQPFSLMYGTAYCSGHDIIYYRAWFYRRRNFCFRVLGGGLFVNGLPIEVNLSIARLVSQIDGIPGESEHGYGKPASGVKLTTSMLVAVMERAVAALPRQNRNP